MSYRVSIKKKAAKALDKIPKGIREKIDAKIEGLKKDPRDGSEKLQGFEDTYCLVRAKPTQTGVYI